MRRKSQSFYLTIAFLIAAGVGSHAQAAQRAGTDARTGVAVQPAQTVEPDETAPAAPEQPAPINSGGDLPEVRIGAGDLLQVSVYGAPDFNKEIRVNSAGTISLPLIGDVKVAGMSSGEAEAEIGRRLAAGGYFSDPHVSVFAKEYATQGISVLGEVLKPGIYPLLGRHSILDAIAAAGGTTPRAGKTIRVTHRDSPGVSETISLSYRPEDPQQGNTMLARPGDTIVVSKAGIIYVVGNVKKPGGFVMENSEITVLQAIAMAEGPSEDAALNAAKLIRKEVNQPKEIPIALKDILTAKSPDLGLQAGDILFIPNSAGKKAVRRSLEAILQTATGIAIYRR